MYFLDLDNNKCIMLVYSLMAFPISLCSEQKIVSVGQEFNYISCTQVQNHVWHNF